MALTFELTHPVVLVTDDQSNYRTECGCGWVSDWYTDDDQAAEAAGADHIEIAVGPPDPVDVLITGLLDAQEDLADVVVWLADNWTASLPAPYPTLPPTFDDTTIGLAVHCDGLAQVHEVADLLGVPAIRCPDRDEYHDHRRYWRACRSFGRVTVTAWGLDP
jgi:hypothetical protein